MSDFIGIGDLSRAVNLHINTLRKLADTGEIPSERTSGGQRRFDLEQVQKALLLRKRGHGSSGRFALKHNSTGEKWQKKFPLNGLSEDGVWRTIAEDMRLDMDENCADIFPYAFTEMLNNAIEHSHGSEVKVTFILDEESWSFFIEDDGKGAFQNIKESFHLDNNFEAIAELTKGKRTTAPEGHSGEGIFFTSKAVDIFEIEANGLKWSVDNVRDDFSVGESVIDKGTGVFCHLKRDTSRSLVSVFRTFTENHEFTKSKPVIKLFETGMMFVSRSEARRLVVGLEKFSEVQLDFIKVKSVGQGFVDEVFRVWSNSHPDTQLIPINMNSSVEFMVLRGMAR